MLGLPFQLPQEEVAWQPSLRPEEPPAAAPGTYVVEICEDTGAATALGSESALRKQGVPLKDLRRF